MLVIVGRRKCCTYFVIKFYVTILLCFSFQTLLTISSDSLLVLILLENIAALAARLRFLRSTQKSNAGIEVTELSRVV